MKPALPYPPIWADEAPMAALKEGCESFVYFIHCHGRVKIGKAKNPKRRLIDLQVHCPFTAYIIWLQPGSFQLEREYHQRFARLRRQGEWFDLSGELADFLWSKGVKL